MAIAFLSSCERFNTSTQTSIDDNSIQRAKLDTINQGIDYLALGKNISTKTQIELARNLMGAINYGGTEHALTFCNANAIQITDSMAHVLNASIKRVSDKPRNKVNQANKLEMKYIQTLKDNIAKGEKPSAKMVEIDGKMVAFYPIVTNQMCLQCHGKTDINIEAATLEKINFLYPDDKATGYTENEIRGLWVVEMNNE